MYSNTTLKAIKDEIARNQTKRDEALARVTTLTPTESILSEELLHKEAAKEELQSELSLLRIRRDEEVADAMMGYRTEYAQLSDELEHIKRSMATLEQTIRSASVLKQQAEQEEGRLRSVLWRLKEETSLVERQSNTLRREISSIPADLEKLSLKLATLEEELCTLKHNHTTSHEALSVEERRLGQLNEVFSSAQENQKIALENEMAVSKAACQLKHQASIEALEAEYAARFEREKTNIEKTLHEATLSLKELETEKNRLEIELETQKIALNKAKDQPEHTKLHAEKERLLKSEAHMAGKRVALEHRLETEQLRYTNIQQKEETIKQEFLALSQSLDAELARLEPQYNKLHGEIMALKEQALNAFSLDPAILLEKENALYELSESLASLEEQMHESNVIKEFKKFGLGNPISLQASLPWSDISELADILDEVKILNDVHLEVQKFKLETEAARLTDKSEKYKRQLDLLIQDLTCNLYCLIHLPEKIERNTVENCIEVLDDLNRKTRRLHDKVARIITKHPIDGKHLLKAKKCLEFAQEHLEGILDKLSRLLLSQDPELDPGRTLVSDRIVLTKPYYEDIKKSIVALNEIYQKEVLSDFAGPRQALLLSRSTSSREHSTVQEEKFVAHGTFSYPPPQGR